MSGSGHIFAMIASLKNNKRNRKTLFDKHIDEYDGNCGKIIDYKKMSSSQFKTFKEKLKENERKRIIKVTIWTAIFATILIGAGVYFLFYF